MLEVEAHRGRPEHRCTCRPAAGDPDQLHGRAFGASDLVGGREVVDLHSCHVTLLLSRWLAEPAHASEVVVLRWVVVVGWLPDPEAPHPLQARRRRCDVLRWTFLSRLSRRPRSLTGRGAGRRHGSSSAISSISLQASAVDASIVPPVIASHAVRRRPDAASQRRFSGPACSQRRHRRSLHPVDDLLRGGRAGHDDINVRRPRRVFAGCDGDDDGRQVSQAARGLSNPPRRANRRR